MPNINKVKYCLNDQCDNAQTFVPIRNLAALYCGYCSSTELTMGYEPGGYIQNPTGARFYISSVLGIGGFGAVYKAEDDYHNEYALKIAHQKAEESLVNEARILSRVTHPNLPKMYGTFPFDQNTVLVMDYIKGQTLDAIVGQAYANGIFLGQRDVLAYVGQIFDAVSFLHSRGIIHRDIKPSNAIRTPGGAVITVDLGIAKSGGASARTHLAARRVISDYFSPLEQYGSGTSERSDVYSLSGTTHVLLTNHYPLPAPDRSAYGWDVEAEIRKHRPSPRDVADHVVRAVAHGMAMDQGQRPTLQEFIDELRGISQPYTLKTVNNSAATPRVRLDPEEERHQKGLLERYKNNLRHLERQKADLLQVGHVPFHILSSIEETERNISKIRVKLGLEAPKPVQAAPSTDADLERLCNLYGGFDINSSLNPICSPNLVSIYKGNLLKVLRDIENGGGPQEVSLSVLNDLREQVRYLGLPDIFPPVEIQGFVPSGDEHQKKLQGIYAGNAGMLLRQREWAIAMGRPLIKDNEIDSQLRNIGYRFDSATGQAVKI